jgi:hypothetical protein
MTKKRLQDDDKWLSPKEALEIARRCYGNDAAKVFIERLRANFFPAVTSRWSDASDGRDPIVSDERTGIPAGFWMDLQDESVFWNAGDARFASYDPLDGARIVRCTGIVFLERHITEQFPAPLPARTPLLASPPIPASTKQEPEQTGPRVSEAALKAWHAAYASAYKEAEQTEAHAVQSAKGMFHDKTVARDRVRALLGARKRGPKPKAEAE